MKKGIFLLALTLIFGGGLYYWSLEEDVSDHPSVSVLIGRRYELKDSAYLRKIANCRHRYSLWVDAMGHWPTSKEEFYDNPEVWAEHDDVVGVIDAGEHIRITNVIAEYWSILGDVRVIIAVVDTGRHKGMELDLTLHTEGICWDETLYIKPEHLASLDDDEEEIVSRPPIPHASKGHSADWESLMEIVEEQSKEKQG